MNVPDMNCTCEARLDEMEESGWDSWLANFMSLPTDSLFLSKQLNYYSSLPKSGSIFTDCAVRES